MPFDRGLNVFGTAEYVDFANSDGQLPTRNFQTGRLDGAEAISGETMKETVLTDTEACWACSVKCKRVVKIDDPYAVDPQYGGPEFETVAASPTWQLRVQVRLFSHLRSALGKRTLDLELPAGSTVATVMDKPGSMVSPDLQSMIVGGEEGGYRLVVLQSSPNAVSPPAVLRAVGGPNGPCSAHSPKHGPQVADTERVALVSPGCIAHHPR